MGAVLLACLAFVLGSFPSGIVLGRLATGRDIRTVGSGNYGAANVVRAAGWFPGLVVALIDIVKGVAPVMLGRSLGFGHAALALVAVMAVLGHDFSLFLRFRGGKGVATTFGVMLVLAPLATVLGAASWLAAFWLSGLSSVGSLLSLALLPLCVRVLGGPTEYIVASFALFVLAAGKHWENIVRLASGTERSFRKDRDG